MTDVAEGMAAVLMRSRSSIFTVAAIPIDTNHNSSFRAVAREREPLIAVLWGAVGD